MLRNYFARRLLPVLLLAWATRALSLVLAASVFVVDGSGANSLVYGCAPSPLLPGLDYPLFLETHTAPLPSRDGHLCNFVRLSICFKLERSTPIALQTRHWLNGTKSPQRTWGFPTHTLASRSQSQLQFYFSQPKPKAGLRISKNMRRDSINASTPRLPALTGVAATRRH